MPTEIFLPMFYILLLTLAVFFLFNYMYIKEIYINNETTSVTGEELRHPSFDQSSDILKNVNRN